MRVRLLRLKQPKYLIGAIVGAAYFWFFFLRRMIIPPITPTARSISPELQALLMMFLAVPLLILGFKRVIEAWIAPDDKPGLAFTEAEVAFLFPWAAAFKEAGAYGFWAMMIFLAVLTIGFIYEWRKGALELAGIRGRDAGAPLKADGPYRWVRHFAAVDELESSSSTAVCFTNTTD